MTAPAAGSEPGLIRTLTGSFRELLARPLTSYYLVLGSSALLLALGLMMVLSASSIEALQRTGNPFYWFAKQSMSAAIGIPLMWICSRLPPRFFRLAGYPVMALSACFGGPMLNILLGIGLSGSYLLLTAARRRQDRNPEKELKFKAYHIDVSNTLIVSGATLLVTLVGLLIAVPANKWVLSRRIGWALIALWTISTIGNVILEVTGFAEVGTEG